MLSTQFRLHVGVPRLLQGPMENLDTGGPLGRAVVIIVSAVAELE